MQNNLYKLTFYKRLFRPACCVNLSMFIKYTCVIEWRRANLLNDNVVGWRRTLSVNDIALK